MSIVEKLQSARKSSVSVVIHVNGVRRGFIFGSLLVEEDDDGAATGWWAVLGDSGYVARFEFDVSDIIDIPHESMIMVDLVGNREDQLLDK